MMLSHRRWFAAGLAALYALVFVASFNMTTLGCIVMLYGCALTYRCMMYWTMELQQ